MANLPLDDIASIQESDLFADDSEFRLAIEGEFRHLATRLVRNAFSKAMLHAETADPADGDRVTGLTQYWINVDSGGRFISVNGGAWRDVTPAATDSDSEDGDDGWSPLFAIESDNDRRVLKIVDWTGGGGDKPAVNVYLTASGVDADITNAVDIRGLRGLPGQADDGDDGDDGWSPVFAIEADGARRVLKVADWQGGSGTKPDINKYVGAAGFVDAAADAVDFRGPAGEDGTGDEGGGGVRINTASRAPTDADLIANTDYIWFDRTRPAIYYSINGASWRDTVSHRHIAEPEGGTDSFNIQSPGGTNPGTGQVIWTSGGQMLKISTLNADGDAVDLSDFLQGDYIQFGETVVYEIDGAPTRETDGGGGVHFWEFTGRFLRRDDSLASTAADLSYTRSERAIEGRGVKDYHIAPKSVGAYEMKDGAVERGNIAEGAITPGQMIDLGLWSRNATSPPSRGDVVQNAILTDNALRMSYYNSANENKTADLLKIRPGDRIYLGNSLGVYHITEVDAQASYIDLIGTWLDGPTAFINGADFEYRLDREVNRVGSEIRRVGQFLKVASDFGLEYETLVQGQDDESDTATAVEINSGLYSTLGVWERDSSTIPDTGKFYVDANAIILNPQDADGTNQADRISGLVSGDVIQFGEINAFELNADASEASGWTLSGAWINTFAAGDYPDDTNITLSYIKSNNRVIRNSVIKDRVLVVGEDLSIRARDSDDSIESLWEGSLGADSLDTNTDINAGLLFSDYSHVIFNYSGSNKRNLWEVPVKIWEQQGYLEVSNKDNHMVIQRMDNNTFRITVATGSIRLRKIHGYKGV